MDRYLLCWSVSECSTIESTCAYSTIQFQKKRDNNIESTRGAMLCSSTIKSKLHTLIGSSLHLSPLLFISETLTNTNLGSLTEVTQSYDGQREKLRLIVDHINKLLVLPSNGSPVCLLSFPMQISFGCIPIFLSYSTY